MRVLLLFLLSCLVACEQDLVTGPQAARHDHTVTLHDRRWNDPYHYLADETHPDTAAYIDAEKRHFAGVTGSFDPLRRQLASEVSRYLLSSWTAPAVRSGQYELYATLERGGQYPVYYRRLIDEGSEAEVILDPNELAGGSDYYAIGDFVITGDTRLVAFTEDKRGAQRFSLRLRDIASGKLLPLAIPGAGAGIAWQGEDLVYVDLDERSVKQVTRQGVLVRVLYREPDPAFSLSVRGSRNDGSVVITAENHRSSEIRILEANGQLRLLAARQAGHRYRVQAIPSPAGGLAVLTNLRSSRFELALCDGAATGPGDWRFVAGDQSATLVDFEVSSDSAVVHFRDGLRDDMRLLDLRDPSGDQGKLLMSAGAGESISLVTSGQDGVFRFRASSVARPPRFVEYDVATGLLVNAGKRPAAAAFDASRYQVQTLWLDVRDGERVPVLLHYRKGKSLGDRPLLLEAYGAYGISQTARFRPETLPLLDRGFILARAYVRGGGELGADWHEAGRLANKPNSFNDFIDVTRALTARGVGHPGRVFARGASAGGTLMAVAMNEAPSLYLGVIARVPFVDLLNTLMDDDMTLTPSDRLEWGDPFDAGLFRVMSDYSPIENITRQAYPDLLIMGALNDDRVGLHEPLKWLATLREKATNQPMMLIDINDDSGHLGASDQYVKSRRLTLEYAFMLTRPGIEDSLWN